jgi:hypothetical protein
MVVLSAAPAAVETTWGLDVLGALTRDKSNVVIHIQDCRLEGFLEAKDTSRVPYVRRTAQQGLIVARVPVAGSFYPGFQFYDGSGDERISIRIDGVERGVAVADADDKRDRLFYLTEPYQFRGGESIELRNLTSSGEYRVEDLILLKEKPPARRFPYAFSDIFAQPAASSAELTWITNWPAECTVEWGNKGESRTTNTSESLAVSNHRMTLQDLHLGSTYRFRITATKPGNQPLSTEWHNFKMESPAPAVHSVNKARLALTVSKPLEGPLAQVFPVTSGVPFPKGALASDRQLRLLDPTGREAPLQSGTLARWPDGTVKWVLLDFQANPAQAGGYSLEYGSGVTRMNFPPRLRVSQTPDGVTISTGPLRFTAGKQRGAIESLSLDNIPIITPRHPAALELTSADGKPYTSLAPPDVVAVEEDGPMRATVRITGHFRDGNGRRLLAYTLRLSAYAGQRFIRIQHTWENDARGDSEFTSIRSLRLRIPLAARNPASGHGTLGGEEDQTGQFSTGTWRLRQHQDDRYDIVSDNGSVKASRKRATGWAEWHDGSRQVTLAVRDFWETYPKDIAVGNDGLDLDICPPLSAEEYAQANGTVDEHRLYYYLQEGLYRFRQGMSQTQDIWLEAAPDNPAYKAAARTQREPLLALAPPQWYADTKAFGELAGPSAAGLLADYDRAFANCFEEYWKDRERDREYGMLNFGDWWGERGVDWGNSEYDTQHAFLMQFLRTGNLRYYHAGEQMEWHNRDIDTIHDHRDVSRIGGVYHHAIGHTGNYSVKGLKPGQGITVGILTVDHVFVRGHLDYYFLTGDRRSFETARSIADRYGTYDTRTYDFDNTRNPGWHLLLTMAVYEATQDRFYLNAAKIIVERVLERQTEDGGWDSYPVCMHTDPPKHFGNFGFTNGVLLTGLMRYYAATQDERAAKEIVRGAYFLVVHLWTPEAGTFRYTSCPRAGAGSPMLTFLLLDGIAFAHQRNGDPKLRDVLIAASRKALEGMTSMDPAVARANMDGIGKELGLYISNAPHFIGYVASLEQKAAGTAAR